jgi:hypothetical protein
MRNTFNKPETYCIDCKSRLDKELAKAVTNQSPFCELGFTQNPTTFKATLSAIFFKAQICHKNPYRNRARKVANG